MSDFERRQHAQSAVAVVGVDAGKFQHCLVVRPKGGRDSKPLKFHTTREDFERIAQHILSTAGVDSPAGVLVGIEHAGNCGATFAHFLHEAGFDVVSVLPSDTRSFQQVVHRQPLKTDEKDAILITDLVAQGRFVSYAFMDPPYAELRYLVSAIERVTLQQSASVTRLRNVLHVAFPEFEVLVGSMTKSRAPLRVLAAFPGPAAVLAARRSRVVQVVEEASRGHYGEPFADRLIKAAQRSIALPLVESAMATEIPMLLAQIDVYREQIKGIEAAMVRVMEPLPEAAALRSVPGVQARTAAVFLGSIGDPRQYESAKQILAIAGLTLTSRTSSGTHTGKARITKRGRPVLRRYAYLAALRAIAPGGLYERQYKKLLERNGGLGKKAVTSISRRYLKLLFAVARDRVPYAGPGAGHRGEDAAA